MESQSIYILAFIHIRRNLFMKRKRYTVTVKVIYVATMDHEQTSMKNAKKDVKRVIEDYLKEGTDIRNIFDKAPQTIYKVEKNDRRH